MINYHPSNIQPGFHIQLFPSTLWFNWLLGVLENAYLWQSDAFLWVSWSGTTTLRLHRVHCFSPPIWLQASTLNFSHLVYPTGIHPFPKMDSQMFHTKKNMKINSSNPKPITQTCLESKIGPLQIISAQSHQLLIGRTSNMLLISRWNQLIAAHRCISSTF